MSELVDTDFDVYSDTPTGKDPDSYSPKLRKYHKLLWSKSLPNGLSFKLTDTRSGSYLHHKSELGEFHLTSDSIGHTYSRIKSMSHITSQLPSNEIEKFFTTCSTIGGYIIFPGNKVNNKMTINGSRGMNRHIKDRFDLTLECIRRHYANEESSLSDTLRRYPEFFNLFNDFQGYVDFFLLQDLVKEDYSSIRFCVPFDSFENPPLPSNVREYQLYKDNITDFVLARNERILNFVKGKLKG